MKRPKSNCQGNIDVLDNIDLLEEILVRLPHESIFNCTLVSKRWFGLICSPLFPKHYLKTWRDKVKSMQRQHLPEPSSDLVSEMQQRLQSQQFAALIKLQRHLGEDYPNNPYPRAVAESYMYSFGCLEENLHKLQPSRVDMVSELHCFAARSDGKLRNAVEEFGGFELVNEMQVLELPDVLALVKELMQERPRWQWAIVNEVQHQIVCELLVAVNKAQREQYREMVFS